MFGNGNTLFIQGRSNIPETFDPALENCLIKVTIILLLSGHFELTPLGQFHLMLGFFFVLDYLVSFENFLGILKWEPYSLLKHQRKGLNPKL